MMRCWRLNLMCGHGMVAPWALIRPCGGFQRSKHGELSPDEGAEKLFEPCMCGIFNPHRAAVLISALAA
jgi:hypothetical protein